LEKDTINGNAIIVFKNILGDIIFQGQLKEDISHFNIEDNKQKPHQGNVMVLVKDIKEVIKCKISFKSNKDVMKFNKVFTKAMDTIVKEHKVNLKESNKDNTDIIDTVKSNEGIH